MSTLKNLSRVLAHSAQKETSEKNCNVSLSLRLIVSDIESIVADTVLLLPVAFKVYDMDRDGFISNGELFLVLKMMVGSNLKDNQLQQIVDKTIMEADKDLDGKISFEEFLVMVENTDVAKQMTLESF